MNINQREFAPIYVAENPDGTYEVTASGLTNTGHQSPAAALAAFAEEIEGFAAPVQLRGLQLFDEVGYAYLTDALKAAHTQIGEPVAPLPIEGYDNPIFEVDEDLLGNPLELDFGDSADFEDFVDDLLDDDEEEEDDEEKPRRKPDRDEDSDEDEEDDQEL